MAESTRDRLLAVIRASDTMVDEDGDSEDPVAFRRVAEALVRKGSALRDLGRLDEAGIVWDQLRRRYADESSAPAARLIMTMLLWKAQDLERIGRHRDSLAAVAELLELSPGRSPGAAA